MTTAKFALSRKKATFQKRFVASHPEAIIWLFLKIIARSIDYQLFPCVRASADFRDHGCSHRASFFVADEK